MKWPLAAVTSIVAFGGADPDFFEMRVRPVLVKNCFACHTKSRMGGLDLSSRAGLIAGGKSGSAVKVGVPAESLLIKAIRHENESLKMPPTGGKLADSEIADVAAWIRDGAVWPEKTAAVAAKSSDFWSFQPVREPKHKSIDLFVARPGPMDWATSATVTGCGNDFDEPSGRRIFGIRLALRVLATQ